jgi:protein TonB
MTQNDVRKKANFGKRFFMVAVLALSLGLLLFTANGQSLNGKAIKLPKPVYPPIAKQAKVSGTVVVTVDVDESGKVTSAKAVSGHKMLQPAAVDAARMARFAPTIVNGKPTKVSGTLAYSFVL